MPRCRACWRPPVIEKRPHIKWATLLRLAEFLGRSMSSRSSPKTPPRADCGILEVLPATAALWAQQHSVGASMTARWATSFGTGIGLVAATAAAGSLPTIAGTCVRTVVTVVGQRRSDGPSGPSIPGSGSAVNFANGGYQVSYDEIEAVNLAQVNDPVVLCLVRLPSNCPPGDERGKLYATIDLWILLFWVLPDSEHACGGA